MHTRANDLVAFYVTQCAQESNAKRAQHESTNHTDDEIHAFHVVAEERARVTMLAALAFDADVLFTRHIFTCVACKQTARIAHTAFARALANELHCNEVKRARVDADSKVTTNDVVRSFDYCHTCMLYDFLDSCDSDDERVIVFAVASREHVKTFH